MPSSALKIFAFLLAGASASVLFGGAVPAAPPVTPVVSAGADGCAPVAPRPRPLFEGCTEGPSTALAGR
jgi:hypothetical protein